MHKIKICKLGLETFTDEGAFYAKVDGYNIGEDGRAFWETSEDAQAAADRFVAKLDAKNQ